MIQRISAKQVKQRFDLLTSKAWMQYFWLLLITLLAAALRLYKLGVWSFWIDEIYTVNHALAHFSTPQLILEHLPPHRNWVPISVILSAQAMNIWGISEWSVRLVSVFIGTISIPVLFFPTRRMFGDQVALMAALLLTVAPWHLFWSQNARFYSSLFLFYSLALAAFHFAMERNKPACIFGFWGLFYLALSERMFAIFIFPVIGVYLIGLWIFNFEKPSGLNLKNLFLLGIPLFVGGMIESYSWLVNGQSRFFADFGWFFLYRNDDPFRLLANISFNIGISLMSIALFGAFFLIVHKNRAGLLITANAVVPLIVLIVANPFIFTKDRYAFIILFSWIVLAAVVIHELFKNTTNLHKWLVVGILVMVLGDASGDNLLYYQVNHGNRAEWKTVFKIIEERSMTEDIVVTYWPEFAPFYLDREFIQYEDIDIQTLLNSGKRYWFVVDAETIYANPDVIAFLEHDARLVDISYLRTPDDFFLRIYFFDPSQPVPQ
jgi:4-amino-4-deoxy-L-arabinose transferase-like glycosyltransferase